VVDDIRLMRGKCVVAAISFRDTLGIAAKVVADVRADIDHLDGVQVLRLAQSYFAGPPVRDFGDSRWGVSGT
jgi:hypothetical protein